MHPPDVNMIRNIISFILFQIIGTEENDMLEDSLNIVGSLVRFRLHAFEITLIKHTIRGN